MNKYIQNCLGILSIGGRIIVFFCFWWAYDGVEDSFSDKRLGYYNEFYAWQSPPIFKIEQFFAATSCPEGTNLLFDYIWNGRKSYNNGDKSFDSIPSKQFTKWVYSSEPKKPFIMCATIGLLNETYTEYGKSNLTCEARKMRSCSNGRFCVPGTYQYCPITTVNFDKDGLIITSADPTEMPIAYFKVDTYFVSGYNNKEQNIYPGQPQDSQLITQLQPINIEYKDSSFLGLNTIDEVLFYSVNDASTYDRTISAAYNKTLFYRRYTEWQQQALGDLFDDAYNIYSSIDGIIIASNSGTITSLVYLLLVCYILPALPFVCRCISSLRPENIIAWDMLVRMILLLMMLAQSIFIIAQCQDVRKYSDLLLKNNGLVNYQDQYGGVIDLINGQEPYHIISIIVSLGLLGIEFFLWFVVGVKEFINYLVKFFKKIQFRKQIQSNIDEEGKENNYQHITAKPQEVNAEDQEQVYIHSDGQEQLQQN